MRVIEVKGLEKTFSNLISRKKVHALRGVDLQVEQGEIFGLLGPNGAGKTTLVKILLGICYNDGGEALLFGEPARNARSRDRVGYLPESHKYPRYLKGKHVMDYYARLSGMSGGARKQAIDQLLHIVRMDKWQDVKMGKYSKGMAQRVGLAVAMVSDPDLLVLDEPTDGVDPLGRKEIRDILMELKKRGKTIFLNSHLLSEVELICDRIAIVNKGRLVTHGTVKELTAASNVWAVDVEQLPERYEAKLSEKGIPARRGDNGQLLLDIPNVVVLNDAIDALRADGLLIGAISRKKQTLEEMFIDVITSEGEASVL